MTTFWQAVLYTHLLAMAFFLGGQLVVALALVPVERANPDPARLRAVARRVGIGSVLALAVLLATGIALAEHLSMWSSDTLRLKLVLVGILIALILIHLRFPRAHALQGLILVLTLVVVWLGLDLAV